MNLKNEVYIDTKLIFGENCTHYGGKRFDGSDEYRANTARGTRVYPIL